MEYTDALQFLNRTLLEEMPEYQTQAVSNSQGPLAQRKLLRSLMNLRPPTPLSSDFLAVQDLLLGRERESRGVVKAALLPVIASNPKLALWQGDITCLRADAIVNAANSSLLGCFHPCHGCIDNAIHSAAGLQLRDACHHIMFAQGHPEPAGGAKLTLGYNLPAKYILHTVGPIIQDHVTDWDREALASCYRSCLDLASRHSLATVAFCCISTGEFHFPNQEAAEIAVKTVTDALQTHPSIQKVIFNVFKDLDAQIYRYLLGPDSTASAGA